MSDDETLVRQRLLLMFGDPAARSAPPGGPPFSGGPRGFSRPAGDGDRGTDLGDTLEVGPPVGLHPGRSDDLRSDPPGAEPATTVDPIGPSPRRLGGVSAFDPGRRGVKALAVLAAVVVLVAAFWAWRARPTAEPVAVTSGPARTPTASTAAPPPSTASSPGADPTEVVVAVAGKVRRPGLVRLPAGARVADAIQAAGGALPGVDVTLLNPARRLTDGELIAVGVPLPAGAAGPAAPGPGPGGSGVGGQPAAGGKLNLNTATLTELDGLPGVGPVLAQRILDHRQQHGAFRSVEDLRQVDGIGESRFQDLKDLVTV